MSLVVLGKCFPDTAIFALSGCIYSVKLKKSDESDELPKTVLFDSQRTAEDSIKQTITIDAFNFVCPEIYAYPTKHLSVVALSSKKLLIVDVDHEQPNELTCRHLEKRCHRLAVAEFNKKLFVFVNCSAFVLCFSLEVEDGVYALNPLKSLQSDRIVSHMSCLSSLSVLRRLGDDGGLLLFSADSDGRIRLSRFPDCFNIEAFLPSHCQAVIAVGASRSGQFISTLSADGLLLWWDLGLDAEKSVGQQFQSSVVAELTEYHLISAELFVVEDGQDSLTLFVVCSTNEQFVHVTYFKNSLARNVGFVQGQSDLKWPQSSLIGCSIESYSNSAVSLMIAVLKSNGSNTVALAQITVDNSVLIQNAVGSIDVAGNLPIIHSVHSIEQRRPGGSGVDGKAKYFEMKAKRLAEIDNE